MLMWPSTPQVFLVFEGVESCASVFVDGQRVGFTKDSRVPVKEPHNSLGGSGGVSAMLLKKGTPPGSKGG